MLSLPRSLARSAAMPLPSRAIARRSYAYASTADLVEKGKRLIPNGVGRKWDIIVEDGKGLDVTLGVSPHSLSRPSDSTWAGPQLLMPSTFSRYRTAARS